MNKREDLKEFYVTFARNHFPHPYVSVVHPDGYIVIEAPDETLARMSAFNLFGQKWAFIYSEKPEEQFAPRGELKRYIQYGPEEVNGEEPVGD